MAARGLARNTRTRAHNKINVIDIHWAHNTTNHTPATRFFLRHTSDMYRTPNTYAPRAQRGWHALHAYEHIAAYVVYYAHFWSFSDITHKHNWQESDTLRWAPRPKTGGWMACFIFVCAGFVPHVCWFTRVQMICREIDCSIAGLRSLAVTDHHQIHIVFSSSLQHGNSIKHRCCCCRFNRNRASAKWGFIILTFFPPMGSHSIPGNPCRVATGEREGEWEEEEAIKSLTYDDVTRSLLAVFSHISNDTINTHF